MWTVVMIITFVTLTLLAAGLSALAMALGGTSVDLWRQRSLAGDSQARLIYPIIVHRHQTLTALIFAILVIGALMMLLVRELLPASAPWMLVALLLDLAIIGFGILFWPYTRLKKGALGWLVRLAPFVEGYLDLVRPLTKPLAKQLDKQVPPSGLTSFSRNELLAMVKQLPEDNEAQISTEESAILQGALTYGETLVEDIMVPRSQIIALEENERITTGTLEKLQHSGHSRIPVYSGTLDSITGMIFMHDLISRQAPEMQAKDIAQKQVFYVHYLQPLAHVLEAFIKTRHQLFIVVNEYQETVGVIAIEDILEKIIGRQIAGEFDRYEDIRAVASLEAKKRQRDRRRTTIS